jgi:hypothetical protein
MPVPVEFSDGRRRTASFRLLRLTQLWSRFHAETSASYAAYEGGDVLDVGAFHGWYAVLLAPKARPGDVLACFEPDSDAYRVMLHNLAALADVFPDLTLLPVPAGCRRRSGAGGDVPGGVGAPALLLR